MIRRTIIHTLIITLISCSSRYDQQFYGCYENEDTHRMTYSCINFYKNNQYSFVSASCFGQRRDSGSYSLSNNIISFQSFNLPASDTSTATVAGLSNLNFIYQPGKIIQIRKLTPPNRPPFLDTLLVGYKQL